MAQPYRPPTKVVTTQTTLLAQVIAVDPEFERKKHWEIEYFPFSSGRVLYADPSKRGAYNTPEKTISIAYTGPATLAAGDITGVGYDFVTTINIAAAPGVLTMRTAAQMFSDIAGAVPNLGYALRVVNFGGTSALTLTPGDPNTLMTDNEWAGQPLRSDVIQPFNFSDYQVQFPDANNVRIKRVSANQPYSAIIG